MRNQLNIFFLQSCYCSYPRLPEPPMRKAPAKPNSTRPNDPLSTRSSPSNSYDLDNELRNSKIGREVELALIEGNKAFSANPPRFDDAEKA